MSGLLIKGTLNVKGAILTEKNLININSFYRRARLQEYIFENSQGAISEDDSLKIADEAIKNMDKSKCNENEAISKAIVSLGYNIPDKRRG